MLIKGISREKLCEIMEISVITLNSYISRSKRKIPAEFDDLKMCGAIATDRLNFIHKEIWNTDYFLVHLDDDCGVVYRRDDFGDKELMIIRSDLGLIVCFSPDESKDSGDINRLEIFDVSHLDEVGISQRFISMFEGPLV